MQKLPSVHAFLMEFATDRVPGHYGDGEYLV